MQILSSNKLSKSIQYDRIWRIIIQGVKQVQFTDNLIQLTKKYNIFNVFKLRKKVEKMNNRLGNYKLISNVAL